MNYSIHLYFDSLFLFLTIIRLWNQCDKNQFYSSNCKTFVSSISIYEKHNEVKWFFFFKIIIVTFKTYIWSSVSKFLLQCMKLIGKSDFNLFIIIKILIICMFKSKRCLLKSCMVDKIFVTSTVCYNCRTFIHQSSALYSLNVIKICIICLLMRS